MTPVDLRNTLDRLGLSQVGAARMLDINDRTFRRYASGELPIPRAVVLLLLLMLRCDVRPVELAELAR